MQNTNKSTAFWIELILSLTAMAVCGGICLVVFVKADSISRRSQAEIEATTRIQSAAEQFKATGDPGMGTESGLTAGEEKTEYFSGDWSETEDPDGAVYRLRRTVSEFSGGLAAVSFSMEYNSPDSAGQEPIFQLTVKKYLTEAEREALS